MGILVNVRLCVKERDADCVSGRVFMCISACAYRDGDGSVVMVWRPGSHRKLQSSPREQKQMGGREGG